MSSPNPANRLRLTIGTKLVGLIAVLLLSSVAGLVWLSTRMFSDDNTGLIQKMNVDTAGSLATRVRENFDNVASRMRMMGLVVMQDSAPAEVKDRLTAEFFSKEKDFLAVFVHKDANGAAPAVAARAVSPTLTTDPQAEQALAALVSEKDFSLSRAARGEAVLAPVKLAGDTKVLAVGIPFIAAEGAKGQFTHTVTALIRLSRFAKAFGESDLVTSFLVDHRGRLLAHPEAARANASEDMTSVDIVRMMLEGKSNNGLKSYVDPKTKEPKLGAYALVGFGALGVVSEVPEAKAFEAAESVKTKATYVALIIVCLSFLFGYLYSGTITRPIKALVEAAHRISQGDFAIGLKPKGGDEVATLSVAFNDMAKGLEERDKVKATFAKFHNKEIADKLLSGEVKLGGERKEATIFFSDVRGFTAMSESMEPEQVVEMLNEYMTRMVSIIRAHNGVVDKYVGDAIMALWGVPIGGDDDAYNALKACLAMRQELDDLNELRLSRGQNALKIGMGLNTGSVIAGNIGSEEKMEYTVIGDSVNLASRMESMTKEYGTDLLIPKVIRDRLDGRFVFEQCKSAKVKGKSQAIEIFKVKGYVDERGRTILVETPYSSYESEKSDKVVHDEPAHSAPAQAEPMEVEAEAGGAFAELGEIELAELPQEIRDELPAEMLAELPEAADESHEDFVDAPELSTEIPAPPAAPASRPRITSPFPPALPAKPMVLEDAPVALEIEITTEDEPVTLERVGLKKSA